MGVLRLGTSRPFTSSGWLDAPAGGTESLPPASSSIGPWATRGRFLPVLFWSRSFGSTSKSSGSLLTEVAEWAGHSVAVLLRVYAKCVDGDDVAARKRIDAALAADGGR
ncbi:hypothetical protein UG55_1016148 [Frankia sp. EI5c]|nr:hypothetical protein UG55_1016148 [Frankia sp. EI5c]